MLDIYIFGVPLSMLAFVLQNLLTNDGRPLWVDVLYAFVWPFSLLCVPLAWLTRDK